jgi:GT2 family glycosyltransferase
VTEQQAEPARTLVAVLVYGGAEFVPACIESAARLVVPGQVDVLVLDDCSPDSDWSRTVRAQCGTSGVGYYRSPRNIGIPRNMNLAVLRAASEGYDYVAITNSDVVFPANLVSAMVDTAQSDPSIASVTAWSNHVSSFSLVNFDPIRTLGSRSSVDRVSTLLERHFRGRAIDIPVGVGFCMLLPVSMIEAVGLFDPIFGRGYCEEVDWCLRADQFGFRNVLAPSAFVYHIGNATTKNVGVLEHWETSDPANEAIIDLRYPYYRERLLEWDGATAFDDLRDEAATELIMEGAREFGYVVEVAAIPRQEPRDETRFVLSPDGDPHSVYATQQAFEVTMRLDAGPVLDVLERRIGTKPHAIVVRDRSDRGRELAEAGAARDIPVIDTYNYPQLVAPRGVAERATVH